MEVSMLFGRAQPSAFVPEPGAGLLRGALADLAPFLIGRRAKPALPAHPPRCRTAARGGRDYRRLDAGRRNRVLRRGLRDLTQGVPGRDAVPAGTVDTCNLRAVHRGAPPAR